MWKLFINSPSPVPLTVPAVSKVASHIQISCNDKITYCGLIPGYTSEPMNGHVVVLSRDEFVSNLEYHVDGLQIDTVPVLEEQR
jgi:hypothetical protein